MGRLVRVDSWEGTPSVVSVFPGHWFPQETPPTLSAPSERPFLPLNSAPRGPGRSVRTA